MYGSCVVAMERKQKGEKSIMMSDDIVNMHACINALRMLSSKHFKRRH